MDPYMMDKLKEMEEEMNRFEQEIAVPPLHERLRHIIGAGTFNNITDQLEKHNPYGPPTIGPSLQFIPHQLHRQGPQPIPTRISNITIDPAPSLSPSSLHQNLISNTRSLTMPPLLNPAVQNIPTGMSPQNLNPHMPPPSYMQQQHSSGFIPTTQTATLTPVVIQAAPAVYSSPPVKKLKVEEPRFLEKMLPRVNPVASLAPKSNDKRDLDLPKLASTAAPSSIKPIGPGIPAVIHEEPTTVKKKERKRKIVRTAGGQCWEDQSLLEWETDDFRIFCGDLGNDVTDEVLTRAFGKFPSFLKAKVVRDKRSNKTKGFGFVSFKDPQDFIRAMKEMNGKYVGSRPIKLRKSTWKERNIDMVKKKMKEKQRLGLR